MSESLGNKATENQRNSGRTSNDQERKRYEGFEGMNYEQRRQPFYPSDTNHRNRNGINNERNDEGRRDEP